MMGRSAIKPKACFGLFLLSAAAGLCSLAEDIPKGDVILDLEGKVKTVENWEWPGWNGYAMKLTNGTLSVTGRMMPRHGRTDVYSGGVLKFEDDSVYIPGAGDAQPRLTVVHDGGTLDLSKGRLNPFNARFIIHPGGTVRLGIDLESRPHGNRWHVKGGKMEITEHVLLNMNEFFIDTNVVFEVKVAKGKYADFSKVTLAPGAKIKETGKGVLIRSHDDPRWKKSETIRMLERMNLKAYGDRANRCYAIYFRKEATNVLKRVVYECPEFGYKETAKPYFICRYPKDVNGPFNIRAVVEAKDGTRVKHTIDIPFNENPVKKPLPNEKFLLGVVSYGTGRERYEMVTNDLGNLYVRWGSWQQLLKENATEEWMEEAEKKDIYSMTIYAHCPREKREEIKTAWKGRYLGNNCGERTGYFYGSSREMRGPQNDNLKDARAWFLSNFFRGAHPAPVAGAEGEDPFSFATSGAAFTNYELPAGIDLVCNELYACGCQNITYATAENRGAARKWGPEWWSGWLAHEWQTFPIPYDKDEKYLSLEVGIKSLWLMGTSLLCLESGSSGTQAHPHTWGVPEANRKSGYRYDDDPPRRYRETIRKCHIFSKEHPRAKGTPETKIALAMGTYDAYIGMSGATPWAQHTNRVEHIKDKVNIWAGSHPEFTWDCARAVFMPYSGTTGVSGMPYGQVDIVGVDDMTRLDDLERYKLLVFGGWNTMTPHSKKVLEKWIEDGGVAVMSIPQCLKRHDRRYLDYTEKDIVPPCGMEVEKFVLSGDVKLASISKKSKVETVATIGKDKLPLVVRKRVGKGFIYLMLTYEFPGSRGILGNEWKKLLAERAAEVEQRLVLKEENKDDNLRFFMSSVYEDKAYVMNLDMRMKRKVKVSIGDKTSVVELDPIEIKEFELR